MEMPTSDKQVNENKILWPNSQFTKTFQMHDLTRSAQNLKGCCY